jgi:hypothetical protein
MNQMTATIYNQILYYRVKKKNTAATAINTLYTLYASNLEGERERIAYPPSAKAIERGHFGTGDIKRITIITIYIAVTHRLFCFQIIKSAFVRRASE